MNLFNHDGSYFKVSSPDMPSVNDKNSGVISLTVEEAHKEMARGTVSINDPNHVYSRVLRPGVRLKVEWGIANVGQKPVSRSLDAMVLSPGGGGDSGGRITYNCSFQSTGWRGGEAVRWWDSGTRRQVVLDALARIGVVDAEVEFSRGSEALNPSIKEMQRESDFAFLVRLSDEYRAAFRVGYGPKGPVASFIDYSRIRSSRWPQMMGSGSTSLLLKYGTGDANVIEYSWQDQSMDSAAGDGMKVIWVDGKPQIYRYVVENEKVVTYRLNEAAIQAELSSKEGEARLTLLTDYLKAKDFEEVKRFFVVETMTTAPQGSGLTLSLKMMGDPLVTAGMSPVFGAGFPERLGASDKVWWNRRVSHRLGMDGYKMDVEVADAFAYSPTGMML